jgi:two-component system, NarL family, response regulator NreC
VVLADDHALLRRALRLLLELEDDLEVVAEAGDLETAAREVVAHRPDVLVVDLRRQDGWGAGRIRRLRAQCPGTGVVVITMHMSALFAAHALDAGALGFVLKDTADQELPTAVRTVARGEVYTSPRLRKT